MSDYLLKDSNITLLDTLIVSIVSSIISSVIVVILLFYFRKSLKRIILFVSKKFKNQIEALRYKKTINQSKPNLRYFSLIGKKMDSGTATIKEINYYKKFNKNRPSLEERNKLKEYLKDNPIRYSDDVPKK